MLSVLLCIKNEAEHLPACLDSLAFADEIVVIDDESVDASKDIVLSRGTKYFSRKMDNDWSEQRNFGLQQCQGNWILVVDADECISETLAKKITSITKNPQSPRKAYLMKRENYFESQKPLHGVLRSDWVKRLFPKEGAHFVGRVHERVLTDCPSEKIYLGSINHFPYDSWDEYFEKFNQYTRLKALDQFEKEPDKSSSYLFDLTIRPLCAFFKTYFLNKGFLDGWVGLILSVNHSFYTLAKYLRLMELKERS